jgi:hypothetical protein
MVATCILLLGCGEGNDKSGTSKVQKSSGMFSGTVAGNEYKVAVNCSYFDKDYFQFKSDKTDISDTNGDGIIISGMENNGQFALTIIDNGKKYSAGNVTSFSKGDNKANGSGKLFVEGTADAHDVQFTVNCD